MRRKAICFLFILFWAHPRIYAEDFMIVAHRGASRAAPENSLPAFKLAWDRGADAIEGDFHLTKDGHIVCIHDKDTGKVAEEKLVIRESTLDALRTLDIGSDYGPEFEGTVIPTLTEVISTVPDQKTIYIEIKCGVAIIPVLLEELAAATLTKDQIVVISFNQEVIRQFKAQAPDHKAFWLLKRHERRNGRTEPSLQEVLQALAQMQADGVSVGSDNYDTEFIEGIRVAGYEYHAWTIDDVAKAKRFFKQGVHSITTNVPGRLKKGLSGAANIENEE